MPKTPSPGRLWNGNSGRHTRRPTLYFSALFLQIGERFGPTAWPFLEKNVPKKLLYTTDSDAT